MKIRKCTVCGKEFESYHGIEVCSETCRIERKRRQDTKGNFRRYNKMSGKDELLVCKYCGKEFYGLNVNYCSPECRNAAHKEIQSENFKIWYEKNKNKDIL